MGESFDPAALALPEFALGERGARELPIHTAAHRRILVLGGDRELVLLAALLCAMLGIAVLTWWSVLLALLLWVASVAGLAHLARRDPLFRLVYARHLPYREFYAPRAGLAAPPVRLPRSWRP
jgi:type IV secretion system protein VirB3